MVGTNGNKVVLSFVVGFYRFVDLSIHGCWHHPPTLKPPPQPRGMNISIGMKPKWSANECVSRLEKTYIIIYQWVIFWFSMFGSQIVMGNGGNYVLPTDDIRHQPSYCKTLYDTGETPHRTWPTFKTFAGIEISFHFFLIMLGTWWNLRQTCQTCFTVWARTGRCYSGS